MGGIFLSYRREDSAGWTGRLAEHLKERFGTESIFMDIDTIQPGVDFTEALQTAVSSCDVLLAIIGPEWATVTDTSGKPRLDDPNDWVRVEISAALKRKIRVIPVLVGGASVPTKNLLPDELAALAQRQAHELTDKRWSYDVEQLVNTLPATRPIVSAYPNVTPTASNARRLTPALIGSVLFVIAVVVWNILPSDMPTTPSESRDSPRPASPIPASPTTASPILDDPPSQPQTSQLKPRKKPTASKPSPTPSTSNASPPPGPRGAQAINLLAKENGGHLIVASSDTWAETIDGKESHNHLDGIRTQPEAVYAFKDERSATIDRFTMLILGTGDANVKEFELFVGNDSPTGAFDSLGTFQTQNVKLMKSPYQEFTFPPIKAKYLKLKLRSTHGDWHYYVVVPEVQLFGRLDPGPPVPSASNILLPPGPRASKALNLLAKENGGHLIVASSDTWAETIDGKESHNHLDGIRTQPEAVYAFKDERSATIDRFTMLILGTGDANVKEFELFVGNDSPTGAFDSLGTFQTQNVKLMKSPYQEFTFPPIKAKYLKLKLRSTHGDWHYYVVVPEVQLFGRLEPR